MPRRTVRREFKIEAVRLATERGVSVPRASRNATLPAAIDRSFTASDRTQGALGIRLGRLEERQARGLHRIVRPMRLNAMRARPKRRGRPRDDGERSVVANKILAHDFDVPAPNRKRLADVACFWIAEVWL